MNGLIRKFFAKGNDGSCKAISEKFSREMVENLMSGEYVEEYAEVYLKRYSNMYKVLSQKQFVATLTNIFREMFEPFLAEEKSKTAKLLVVQLMKRIIELQFEPDTKFSQFLIASGYLAWTEIQEGNHTVYGFNEAFDELIDVKYDNGEDSLEIWPWSFDSFSLLYDIGRQKMQDDYTNFFSFEMQTIFSKNFDAFLKSASYDSVKFLKKLENEGFFIAGNILDKKARSGEITYEYMDAVEIVALQYPELRSDMYNSILLSLLNSTLEEMLFVEQFGVAETFSYYILEILNKMADYVKYQSMVFNVKDNWKDIINGIFYLSDGCVLNEVSELLVDSFGVSKEELESYIEGKTWELLMSVYGLGEMDYVQIFDSVTRKLANKIVYDIVTSKAFGLYDLKVW